MVIKQCVVCGRDFDTKGSAKTCSDECRIIRNRERRKKSDKRYYQKNREAIIEYKKKHYQKNREAIIEYQRKYNKKHREVINEHMKEYYQRNRGAILEYKKKYYQKNKGAIKEYKRKYTLAKLNEYYHELADLKNISEDELRKIIPIWFIKRELECVNEGSYFIDFVCAAFDRASGKCELTGKKSNNLAVHHLNGYNWYIEGRMDVDNAIVIDKDIHDAFHNKYGKGDNTEEQWLEFVEDYNKTITTLDDFGGEQ